MPVFKLTNELVFPPVELAEPDGLLAVGGDLTVERLLLAYKSGIFPWFEEDSPILWWSTDPRLVLFPDELKVRRTLMQSLRKRPFQITVDTCFRRVITACSNVHNEKSGTWITPEMLEAYCTLHTAGYAHSVESWQGGELVGGLYGVSIGGAFFGESMFNTQDNASKAAFVHLVGFLQSRGCHIIDCQMTTTLLQSFGAREIPRDEFMEHLKQAISSDINMFNPQAPSA